MSVSPPFPRTRRASSRFTRNGKAAGQRHHGDHGDRNQALARDVGGSHLRIPPTDHEPAGGSTSEPARGHTEVQPLDELGSHTSPSPRTTRSTSAMGTRSATSSRGCMMPTSMYRNTRCAPAGATCRQRQPQSSCRRGDGRCSGWSAPSDRNPDRPMNRMWQIGHWRGTPGVASRRTYPAREGA